MVSIVDRLLFCHSFSRHFRRRFHCDRRTHRRSGTGTQHFVDGLVYTGQWKNDKMNGKGNGTRVALFKTHNVFLLT